MPSWWAKSSSKDANKKSEKGSFINKIQKKFRIVSEGKCNCGSGSSGKQYCDAKHASHSPISPSTQVSRLESFAERPQALPLPLPAEQQNTKHRIAPSNKEAAEAEGSHGSKSFMFLPLPKPSHGPDPVDAHAVVGTAFISSDKSTDIATPLDLRIPGPQASGYKNRKKVAANSPFSVIKKNQSPISVQKISGEKLKATNTILDNQVPTSHKPSCASSHVPNTQIPQHGALFSAPDSNMSSPSRSPLRACGPELVMNSGCSAGRPCADLPMLGSGHCSSPGSGHNSSVDSVVGDLAGQLSRQHRCSPECSPIQSPRMTSTGPNSRLHSGAVTPLHPQARGAIELPAEWPDVEHQRHRLSLPPINTTCSSCLTETTPVSRSPSSTENPSSRGPRWKKGKLLGRGTFGQVFIGFDSENGEMCAMKEVPLFPNDKKSKECAQQLQQEIALLSHLRHPNIVQYFGSEIVDDKMYIYLEYVSGGSIYKLLQDYGQLGEPAIRSYTQQILSGLAYLHAGLTIHRDIKGANLLVDPNGRVKLADFGMAKHVSGQSGPLSFKGSPYWMAPEIIIKNSNGCNLAVDIWSLGCTVFEMATAKPPWSQFEGVAAIFKIGHSKELPEIPQYLSNEGKDFIMRCLQRNPLDRPSAVQLLEHPFVKSAAPPERLMPYLEPSETIPSMEGYGNARNLAKGAVIKHSRGPKNDAYVPRNIPLASQNTSSLLHPLSPHHMSPMPSVSPISSPGIISGSSTPLTGGGGAIPFHLSKQQPIYSREGMGIIPKSQKSPGISGSSTPCTGSGGAIPFHLSKPPPVYSHEGMEMTPRSQKSRNIISASSTPLTGGGGAIPFDLSRQQPIYSHEGMAISPRSQKSPGISGSSTPLTGGGGAIPFHLSKQTPIYSDEGIGITLRSQKSRDIICGSSTPLTGGGGAIPFHLSKKAPIYSHEVMGITPRYQMSANIILSGSGGGGAIPFDLSKQPPFYLHEGMGITPRSQKNPEITSGSSTPLTGGGGAIPCHLSKQPPVYSHEGMSYKELQPDLILAPSKAYHTYQETVQSKKDFRSGDQ